MTDARIIENGQALTIEIDTDIYPDVVIDKVLYWFSADYIILRKKVAQSSTEQITLKSKDSSSEIDWTSVIAELSQKLIDYKNRKVVQDETSNLRELFFAKAFANNDDFVEFDYDLLKDTIDDKDLLNKTDKKLKKIGFKYVTLDMAGYEMGSMNK